MFKIGNWNLAIFSERDRATSDGRSSAFGLSDQSWAFLVVRPRWRLLYLPVRFLKGNAVHTELLIRYENRSVTGQCN